MAGEAAPSMADPRIAAAAARPCGWRTARPGPAPDERGPAVAAGPCGPGPPGGPEVADPTRPARDCACRADGGRESRPPGKWRPPPRPARARTGSGCGSGRSCQFSCFFGPLLACLQRHPPLGPARGTRQAGPAHGCHAARAWRGRSDHRIRNPCPERFGMPDFRQPRGGGFGKSGADGIRGRFGGRR